MALAAPWGKLAFDGAGRIIRRQSLTAHSRDVAAALAALLSVPGIAARLARLAAPAPFDALTCARLVYLAYLHDCGKVNTGFQARSDRHAKRVGHIAPLAVLLGERADAMLATRAAQALAADRLAVWGAGWETLFDAVLSHHGKPWPIDDDRRHEARHWRPTPAGYDPFAALGALRAEADRFVPHAFHASAAPLPTAPGFVHAVAGLVQLADWIASSDWERDPALDDASGAAWASARLCEIGLDVRPLRAALGGAVPTFEALFDTSPYPHQALAADAAGRLVIVESETGSGKTEAALWRFVTLFARGDVDGLYFALPTRTAAVQLHRRVEKFAARLWPNGAPPVVLAVPGYLDDHTPRADREGLPAAPDPLDDAEADTRMPSVWASEHPKRYFAGVLGVGTIDQALLAALRVKHAHLRGALLMRHLLVVDEVHASDAYMRRLLGQLLRDHLDAGGHAVLLSATLGAEARHQLLVEAAGGRTRDVPAPTQHDAVEVPYPLLSTEERRVPIAARARERAVAVAAEPWLDDPAAITRAALDAARDGAKVLVVRNTVDGAVAVQRALIDLAGEDEPCLFRVAGVATLHHGRFAREDRRLLDRAVQDSLGRTRPPGGRIVVGTQTLEQSLDIDADFLITDLCPADVLLQRLGRLHRHAIEVDGKARVRPSRFAEPRAVVLVPAGGLAPFLAPRRAGGLGRHGLGHRLEGGVPKGVYPDLTVLEATRHLVDKRPVWHIPAMNRALVEGALHSQAIDALLETMPADEQEKWRAHRERLEGDRLAQGQQASDGVLRRHRGFREEGNAAFEDRLPTRLGADDRLVVLPEPPVGPLGEVVRQLAVPEWMARGVEKEDAPTVTADGEGATRRLRITLGPLEFIYDRLGLRTAEEEVQ